MIDRATRSIIDHLKIVEGAGTAHIELCRAPVAPAHALDLAAHVDRYCDFQE